MLSDRDDVGAGNLENLDPLRDRRVEVDVVGADAGGDAELEVLGLVEELAGEVAGVEGRSDDDVGLQGG